MAAQNQRSGDRIIDFFLQYSEDGIQLTDGILDAAEQILFVVNRLSTFSS